MKKIHVFWLLVCACVVAFIGTNHAKAAVLPVGEQETACCFSQTVAEKTAILREFPEIVTLNTSVVKSISFENSKTCDKLFKSKFLSKENFWLKQSIASYLFYIHSLSHHQPSFIKLCRLNI